MKTNLRDLVPWRFKIHLDETLLRHWDSNREQFLWEWNRRTLPIIPKQLWQVWADSLAKYSKN